MLILFILNWDAEFFENCFQEKNIPIGRIMRSRKTAIAFSLFVVLIMATLFLQYLKARTKKV